MQRVSAEGPCEFRCQSGYFSQEGSGALLPALEEWADNGHSVRLLLGSNRAATVASHIAYLVGRLRMPRSHVMLGIVSFEGALFHPKVYHFRRQDGSEAAYVGSANLTGPGLAGSNVEAGLIVDTRDGDDPETLKLIRERIDAWFASAGSGYSAIGSPEDVERLLDEGFLSIRPDATSPESGSDEDKESVGQGPHRPRRTRLFQLPSTGKSSYESNNYVVDQNHIEVVPVIAETNFSNYRYTEASFHYPQGTHLGHIFSILWRFSTSRQGTAFDDQYIRLKGSLGSGRIASFRRQIKYKLLAAMELGLLSDIRLVDHPDKFVPELTQAGQDLWDLLSPHVDTKILEMESTDEPSSVLPQNAAFYNQLTREARRASPEFDRAFSELVLSMPAVGQMLEYLDGFPEARISKDQIYRGFFEFPAVISFCDEVGIEPQTEESARHRCPFIINMLESIGKIDQERTHVVRS